MTAATGSVYAEDDNDNKNVEGFDYQWLENMCFLLVSSAECNISVANWEMTDVEFS